MALQSSSDFPPGDIVTLEKDDNTRVLVHLHGATVLSWVCHGMEQLFLSSKNSFDNKAPIRGGIPVVFPNFGPWSGDRPMHGFARIKKWTVATAPHKEASGDVSTVLELQDDEDTRQMWNHRCKLVYTLRLTTNSLLSSMQIVNTGETSFEFSFLLHTYFRVADVRQTTIQGLKGLTYFDKLKDMKECTQDEDPLIMTEESARIFKDSPPGAVLIQTSPETRLQLTTTQLPNIVVWNPWEATARTIPDLEDDAWTKFVCVEAGRVTAPATLAAGDSFDSSQTFTILK